MTIEKARAQAERNMQNEVGQIINRSMLLKFISSVISAIKIVISSVFLSKFSAGCDNGEFNNWIILMIVHDTANIFYVVFYMVYSKFFANRRSLMLEYENQIRAQYQPLNEEDPNANNNFRENNQENNQDLVESQCKLLLFIKEINKV